MAIKFKNAVDKAEGLSPKAMNLLRFLADKADRKGRSFYRQTTLAERLVVSERTIRAAFKELDGTGWIIREKRWRHDGSRCADLVTVRDAEAARIAAEAMLKLPLMQIMTGGAKTTYQQKGADCGKQRGKVA